MGSLYLIFFVMLIIAIALFSLINGVKTSSSKKGIIKRLVVGYFLPPLLGSLFYTIFDKFISSGISSRGNFYELFFGILIFAFIFTSIQSVLYSYLMEHHVNTSDNSHLKVILISIFMGGISGALTISLIYIGLIVGLVSGVILRIMFIKSATN